MPVEVTLLQSVMGRSSTYEDCVRWGRCLSEILKQAGQLCNESAKAAYVEVSSRLQVSTHLVRPIFALTTAVLDCPASVSYTSPKQVL